MSGFNDVYILGLSLNSFSIRVAIHLRKATSTFTKIIGVPRGSIIIIIQLYKDREKPHHPPTET